MYTNEDLIEHLAETGVLRSPQIKTALERFPREYFVPTELKEAAYEDRPLPIGAGQTISQPYTIVFMLEEMAVQPGDKVLEIGAGSGWQTAIISHLVGVKGDEGSEGGGGGRRPSVALAKDGHVWAYEINHQVAEFGKSNLARARRDAPPGPSLQNIDYIEGDATVHAPEHAPYNRIIAGAAFGDPVETQNLASLLTIKGRMVFPTAGNDVRVIDRVGKNKFQEKIYPGFVFVPVVHE